MVGRPRFSVDSDRDWVTPARILCEVGDQRPYKFPAALRHQEAFQRGNGRLVTVANGQLEPGKQHFIVSGVVEAKLGLELGQAIGWQLARQAVDESKLLRGRP